MADSIHQRLGNLYLERLKIEYADEAAAIDTFLAMSSLMLGNLNVDANARKHLSDSVQLMFAGKEALIRCLLWHMDFVYNDEYIKDANRDIDTGLEQCVEFFRLVKKCHEDGQKWPRDKANDFFEVLVDYKNHKNLQTLKDAALGVLPDDRDNLKFVIAKILDPLIMRRDRMASAAERIEALPDLPSTENYWKQVETIMELPMVLHASDR